jgi:hypothetical protein
VSIKRTIESILDRLEHVEGLLGSTELTGVPADGLPPITESLRRIQSRCDALGVAIATQARATGTDPGATLLGRGKVSGRQARQETTRARVVERMPELGDALRHGDVSGEHLDAVGRARSGLSGDEAMVFDRLAPELAEAATKLPVDTFAKKVRTLVDDARADHGMTRLQQQRARSSLKMWVDTDGMGQVRISADPERFAKIQTAVEAGTAALAVAAKRDGQSVVKGPSLQLDALVELLGQAQGAAARPLITVLVDDATLTDGPHEHTVCETDAGVPLPTPVVDRFLCDAVVRSVRVDANGLPLDVGRKYRTATSAQWAALTSLYATCAWKGCDRPITWTQAHHIHEWEHGGVTDLANLVPLCSEHHHSVHDDGWRLWLRSDRTLEIHHPLPDPERPLQSWQPHHRERPPNRPAGSSLWATTRPDRQSRSGGPPRGSRPTRRGAKSDHATAA